MYLIMGKVNLMILFYSQVCQVGVMRRGWGEERRNNQQQAEWIVAWLRENGPATIRQIVGALNESRREVKAHIIQRALIKSPFICKIGETNVDGEIHSLWGFSSE